MRGKFEITKLSPGTAYEVAFVILLKENAYGWEVPVNVRLVLPDGKKQERGKAQRGMDRDPSRQVCSITSNGRRGRVFN